MGARECARAHTREAQKNAFVTSKPQRPDEQFENKLSHGPNLARYEIANNFNQYGFPRTLAIKQREKSFPCDL